MNSLEMVVIIVAIVSVANVLKVRRGSRHDRAQLLDVTPNIDESNESRRLRDEVQQLKNRIQVLERIAVEKENSLAREIDQLRDR
jgi:uncharacterized protein YlxW (UPF0749 family)